MLVIAFSHHVSVVMCFIHTTTTTTTIIMIIEYRGQKNNNNNNNNKCAVRSAQIRTRTAHVVWNCTLGQTLPTTRSRYAASACGTKSTVWVRFSGYVQIARLQAKTVDDVKKQDDSGERGRQHFSHAVSSLLWRLWWCLKVDVISGLELYDAYFAQHSLNVSSCRCRYWVVGLGGQTDGRTDGRVQYMMRPRSWEGHHQPVDACDCDCRPMIEKRAISVMLLTFYYY